MSILSAWWFVPILITISLPIGSWLLTRTDQTFAGSFRLIALWIISLGISHIAWVIGGICK